MSHSKQAANDTEATLSKPGRKQSFEVQVDETVATREFWPARIEI